MANIGNQSLIDAYNALFSDSAYGALLRRRVRMGLTQRTSPGGQSMGVGAPVPNAGEVTSNPYPDARGGVPGVPGSSSRVSGGVGIPGTSVSRPNFSAPSITFSGPTSSQWGRLGGKYGFVAGGPLGAGLGWGIGRLAGALRDSQFYSSIMPGYGMPRTFSAGGAPGAVDFGRTDNSIGGPDERGSSGGGFGGGGLGGGGSSGGGLGGGSGAEGPDPSSWG